MPGRTRDYLSGRKRVAPAPYWTKPHFFAAGGLLLDRGRPRALGAGAGIGTRGQPRDAVGHADPARLSDGLEADYGLGTRHGLDGRPSEGRSHGRRPGQQGGAGALSGRRRHGRGAAQARRRTTRPSPPTSWRSALRACCSPRRGRPREVRRLRARLCGSVSRRLAARERHGGAGVAHAASGSYKHRAQTRLVAGPGGRSSSRTIRPSSSGSRCRTARSPLVRPLPPRLVLGAGRPLRRGARRPGLRPGAHIDSSSESIAPQPILDPERPFVVLYRFWNPRGLLPRARWFGPPTGPGGTAISDTIKKARRVLAVDDDPAIRRMLGRALSSLYEVVVLAADGAVALERSAGTAPTSSCSTCACPSWTAGLSWSSSRRRASTSRGPAERGRGIDPGPSRRSCAEAPQVRGHGHAARDVPPRPLRVGEHSLARDDLAHGGHEARHDRRDVRRTVHHADVRHGAGWAQGTEHDAGPIEVRGVGGQQRDADRPHRPCAAEASSESVSWTTFGISPASRSRPISVS